MSEISDNLRGQSGPGCGGKPYPDCGQDHLSIVMEVANLINSHLDLDQILSRISRELARIIDYDIGCIAVHDENEKCLYIRHIYRRNGDNSGEGRYVPLEETNLIGWVALNRKPVYRPDINRDHRFAEIMKEDKLRSDIVVPLIAGDSLIGTVNIGSYEEGHFTDCDVEMIRNFSRLTSIAIKNSKLFEELNTLGEKYTNLMSNASDIIVLMEISGEILECSDSMCRVFGFSREEIVGKEIFQFATPEMRDNSSKSFSKILKGDMNHISNAPHITKSGEIVYLDVDPIVMRLNERPCVLAIAHDITERKLLERKITLKNRELKKKNEKLMQLDKMKSEFLGRVSHELRTPLSVIMAYVSALLDEKTRDPIDEDTRKEFLGVISVQSEKLLTTINDLLDLSTVEISDTMMNMAQGSINEILRISVEMIEQEARKKEIRVMCDLDASLPIVNFDPHRIRQVCLNLLSNAVKFTKRGKEIFVRSTGDEKQIVVSIKDSGPGIEEKDVENIFKNFTQIDGGSSRLWDGMGIGLRLVKHYVDLHGGRVWVESEKGSGSTFYFSIPAIASISNLPEYLDKHHERT